MKSSSHSLRRVFPIVVGRRGLGYMLSVIAKAGTVPKALSLAVSAAFQPFPPDEPLVDWGKRLTNTGWSSYLMRSGKTAQRSRPAHGLRNISFT